MTVRIWGTDIDHGALVQAERTARPPAIEPGAPRYLPWRATFRARKSCLCRGKSKASELFNGVKQNSVEGVRYMLAHEKVR